MSYTLEDLLNNRALTAKGSARPFVEKELNARAIIVRDFLGYVKDAAHLQDLYQEMKGRHAKNACEDLWNYYRFIARTASPQLTQEYFLLAVGLFSPVVERRAVFALGSAERVEREKLDTAYQEQQREHTEKRGDIIKIDTGSSEHMVHQKWVASKREYLEYEGQYEMQRYHPSGYGTSVIVITEETTGEHTGKFTCQFHRSTSSD